MSLEKQTQVPQAADWVAGGLTIALFTASLFLETQTISWLKWLGTAALLIAATFIVAPFYYLSKQGKPRKGDPFYATTKVVDRGIYRIVRHPQYLGYILLVLGFSARTPHPLIVALGVGAAGFFYLQSVLEERFCRKKLGPDYESYVKRVPRFNFLLGIFRVVHDLLTSRTS